MKSSSEDNILGVHDIVEDLQASQAGIPLHRGRVTYDAVILDAKLRQALMTTRSLGRRGKRVAALETTSAMEKSKHVPTFASRWCQQAGIVPAYEQRAEPFLGALRHFLDQYGARVLISASDGTIAVLRKHREEIEKKGTRLALPTEASLAIAIDKNRTLAIAENLGLGVPRGVKITSPGDVKAALKEIGLPAVVKPTESWLWGEGQGSRLTCKLVTTAEEAQRAVNDLTAAGGSVLFQHFLSGRQESISLFYVRGQTYARFAQWTRRAHPPLGGVSTYRESIELPTDTTTQAERLIREIGLEGYSQIQFRRDSRGKPYLMEINPRLTSGVEIAVRAGIDFPYLVYQWANEEPLMPSPGYRTGMRMRYLEGDLLTTLQTIVQRGRPGVTPPLQALLEFLTDFFVPSGYDYLDWQDLGPTWAAIGEMVDHVQYRLKHHL